MLFPFLFLSALLCLSTLNADDAVTFPFSAVVVEVVEEDIIALV